MNQKSENGTVIYWMGRLNSSRAWHGAARLAQMQELFHGRQTAVLLSGHGRHLQSASELAQIWHIPYPLVSASFLRANLPFSELPLLQESLNVVWVLDTAGCVRYRRVEVLPVTAVNQAELYQAIQTPVLRHWSFPKKQIMTQAALAC
jgi:hypothetical protein